MISYETIELTLSSFNNQTVTYYQGSGGTYANGTYSIASGGGRLQSPKLYTSLLKSVVHINVDQKTSKQILAAVCYTDTSPNNYQYWTLWHDLNYDFSLPDGFSSTGYFYVSLRYSDGSALSISDINSVTCEVAKSYEWIMINEEARPVGIPDLPSIPNTNKSFWRITPGINNGYPYTGWMPVRGIDMWALEREINTIRVYDIAEPQTGFDHNGLAALMPVSCRSRHDDDVWEIKLVHPLDEFGKWKNLLPQNVLKVDGQLFRIDIIEPEYSDEGGFISVHARHITEDLADDLIIEATFEGGNAVDFINFCWRNGITTTAQNFDDIYHEPYRFEYYSDIEDVRSGSEYKNVSLWGAIVGVDNCLLNRYGGELYRNNFYFSVNKRMEKAKDNAFFLRYSLDMVKIKQKIDYSDFCTNLDCRDNFGNSISFSFTPNERWLIHHPKRRFYRFNYSTPEEGETFWDDAAALWSRISAPKVSYEIQIASLRSDPRYSDFLELQNYNYGDSGTIYCPELDIITTQKISEIEKDEITGDILFIKLGNTENSFIRPTFMGSTISTGRELSDKQSENVQEMLIGASIANAEKYSVSRLESMKIRALEGG